MHFGSDTLFILIFDICIGIINLFENTNVISFIKMWYRVFGYPNRLYTAREILALSLMPNDLISVNAQDNLFGFSEWYVLF